MPHLGSEPSPPSDPIVSARLRWRFVAWTGALFLALVVGGWIVADQRGQEVYRQHLAELEAAGRTRDPAKLFTPAVEGTFFGDASVRELLGGGGQELWHRFASVLRADPEHSWIAFEDSLSTSYWPSSPVSSLPSAVAFEEWYPSLDSNPRDVAERVMAAISELDDGFDYLRDALDLARSSSWPEPEHIGSRETLYGVEMEFWIELLILRFRCCLASGQPNEALREAEVIFRALGHLRDDPWTHSAYSTRLPERRFLGALSEGMRRWHWDDPSLAAVDALIAERIASYPDAGLMIERELGMMHAKARWWATWEGRDEASVYFLFSFRWGRFLPRWAPFEPGTAQMADWFWGIIPPGMILQELVEWDRWLDETVLNTSLPLVDRAVSLEGFATTRSGGFVRNLPYVVLALSSDCFGSGLARHEDSLALLHMARAAVAAERYRLVKGWFPPTWDDFVPGWLDAVPDDPWSSGSLIYRLDEEGRPLIYSVGRNGSDEGGVPGVDQDIVVDSEDGDLVWR